jgi:hypothetical protein
MRLLSPGRLGAVGLAVVSVLSGRPAAAEVPTFTKDIAPILFKDCVSCHRPGEIAPMSLLSYETVRPWAKSIKRRVVAREMPPWFADPNESLKFRNDNSLTQAQIDTIVAWVDGGTPRGKDSDLPPAPVYASGWSHPKGTPPDYVIGMPAEYHIPAEGEVPNISFYVKSPFAEDKFFEAAEMRPGNRAVVHHAGAYARTLPEGTKLDEMGQIIRTEQSGRQRSNDQAADQDRDITFGVARLVSFSPGRGYEGYREGSGKRLAVGKYIDMGMHYQPDGKPETDRTMLGLWFQKVPMTHEVVQIGVYDSQIVEGRELVGEGSSARKPAIPNIPAYAENWSITGIWPVKENATLLSIEPHMHFRGKDVKYTVIFPDGREQPLLTMKKYEAVWQINHELEKPMSLPAGSKVVAYGHYDNSPNNRYNPAPNQEVFWSEQSWDEMYHPYIEVTYDARDLTKEAPKAPTPQPQR